MSNGQSQLIRNTERRGKRGERKKTSLLQCGLGISEIYRSTCWAIVMLGIGFLDHLRPNRPRYRQSFFSNEVVGVGQRWLADADQSSSNLQTSLSHTHTQDKKGGRKISPLFFTLTSEKTINLGVLMAYDPDRRSESTLLH